MAYKLKEKQNAYHSAWFQNNKEYVHAMHKAYYERAGRKRIMLKREFQRLCDLYLAKY